MIDLTLLQNSIPAIQHATTLEKIHKGFSPDHKYIVHFHNQPSLILKVGSSGTMDDRRKEKDLLLALYAKGVRCPKPIDSGHLLSLDHFYQIYSYIDGDDAETTLPQLSKNDQYQIGLVAGRELALMHTVSAPESIASWEERALIKHTNYLASYHSSGVKLQDDQKLIDFIEANKHFLKNRPNQFQHDDFHLNNIMIKDSYYSGAIDFNGYDWGDPYHDFVKIALFSRQTSIPFSIGQIHGYFNHQIPETFWTLYSIYTAMTVFSSIVWSLRVAPEQFDEMLGRLHTVLRDHHSFDQVAPSWFTRNVQAFL